MSFEFLIPRFGFRKPRSLGDVFFFCFISLCLIGVFFSNLEVIPNEVGILQTCWGFFTGTRMGDISYQLSDSQAPAAAAE